MLNISAFRTLPFPTMISLLVVFYMWLKFLRVGEKLESFIKMSLYSYSNKEPLLLSVVTS